VLRALFSRRADAEGAALADLARRYMEGPAQLKLLDFVSKGAEDLTFWTLTGDGSAVAG
jgi:hypothetical protein